MISMRPLIMAEHPAKGLFCLTIFSCGAGYLLIEAQKKGGLLLLDEAPPLREGEAIGGEDRPHVLKHGKGICILNPRTGRTRLVTYGFLMANQASYQSGQSYPTVGGCNGHQRIGETPKGVPVYMMGTLVADWEAYKKRSTYYTPQGRALAPVPGGITYAITRSDIQKEAARELERVGFSEHRQWHNTFHSGGSEKAEPRHLTMWRAEVKG